MYSAKRLRFSHDDTAVITAGLPVQQKSRAVACYLPTFTPPEISEISLKQIGTSLPPGIEASRLVFL